jgi:hypothetical protein
MDEVCLLEINLYRRQAGVYGVEFRFGEPGSAVDIRPGAAQTADIRINLAQLQFQIFDPGEYSRSLSQAFFSDGAVREAFTQARNTAARLGVPLRVSLNIAQDCAELQGIYWELLCDPDSATPLFLGENLYFSRYLSSADWRKVKLRPKAKLHTLALIANPQDLSEYQGLEPITVEAEAQRARQGLGDIPMTVLGLEGEHASLTNLVAHLQTEKPDILYIICHGAMVRGEPYLWLEDPTGKTAVTAGKELVERIKELAQMPLLIVLASCQSAGHESAAEARSALGPRLAEAGIPAVVAMQGNISQETIAEFMPAFFNALQQDGQIDRAMSLGRGRVRQQPDFWMPVLFCRLKTGTIFAEQEAARAAIHIGWKNWAVLASMFLMGIGAVIAYLIWPRAQNMRVQERCSLCIAVAGFQQIGPAEEENLGENSGAELSGLLDQNLEELRQSSSNIIKVWGPNEINTLQADNLEKLDETAAELAQNIGADILVYGTIDTTGDDWQVKPRFVISPDYFFKDLIDIIGQHQLGSPYEVKENVYAIRRQILREKNSQRSRLLATIVLGETYTALNDYKKSLAVFQSVEDDPEVWEDPAANKLINLLKGNAAGRYYSQVKSPELLSMAENYYDLAKNTDANYARAYLGLASVAYTRALQPIHESTNPDDLNSFIYLDTEQAENSLAYTEKAAQLVELPDLAHIQEKVYYGRGQIYMAQILYRAMTTMEDVDFQPAIDEFQKVIDAFLLNQDEVLKELAAESHAQLGEIYSLTDQPGIAADHYRQAIQLNHDPQREKEFKKALSDLDE